ncbi:MAG: hypothetical protein QXN87_05195 [Candidatus Bathyarchaeia archaeon]
MKRVAVIIRQPKINEYFPQEFQLTLKDEASIIETIRAVGEEIKKKAKAFPIEKYKSLLQMVYHPIVPNPINKFPSHVRSWNKQFSRIIGSESRLGYD